MNTADNAKFLRESTAQELADAGWVRIGSGAYRSAYLGPDGYVYKVQHENDWWETSNRDEWENFQLYGAKIASSGICRLATCIDYHDDSNVIVMEYVKRAADAYFWADEMDWYETPIDAQAKKAHKILSEDFQDWSGSNVYYDEFGMIVMVDYAA